MIQEAEAQFITAYQVCEPGLSDRALWGLALDGHRALFGHPPHLAVADGGFASRKNERAAQDRGVRHVVLPWQPRARRSRAAKHVMTDNPSLKAVISITNPARSRVYEFSKRPDA